MKAWTYYKFEVIITLKYKEQILMSLKLGILTASVRETRVGPTISNWLFWEISLLKLKDVSLEIIDLKDYPMPFVGL